MRSSLTALLTLVALLLFITGCGLKGDLYLPEDGSDSARPGVEPAWLEPTEEDELVEHDNDDATDPGT